MNFLLLIWLSFPSFSTCSASHWTQKEAHIMYSTICSDSIMDKWLGDAGVRRMLIMILFSVQSSAWFYSSNLILFSSLSSKTAGYLFFWLHEKHQSIDVFQLESTSRLSLPYSPPSAWQFALFATTIIHSIGSNREEQRSGSEMKLEERMEGHFWVRFELKYRCRL